MKPKTMLLPFPAKGINQGWPSNAQPQLTTPDALNVITYEPNSDRARGGQRWGTAKLNATALNNGGRIMQLYSMSTPGIESSTSQSVTELVEVVRWNDTFNYASGAGLPVRNANYTGALYLTDGSAGGATTSQPACQGSEATFTPSAQGGVSVRRQHTLGTNDNFVATTRVSVDNWDQTGSYMALVVALPPGLSGGLAGSGNITLRIREQRYAEFGRGIDLSTTTWTSTDFGAGFFSVGEITLEIRQTASTVGGTGTRTLEAYVNGVQLGTSQSVTKNTGTFDITTACFTPTTSTLKFAKFRGQSLVTSSTTTSLVQTPTTTTPRRTWLIAQSLRNLYVGEHPGSLAGFGQASNTSKPSMCDINGLIYYVNGTDTKVIDPTASTFANITASAGTVPTLCRIAVNWRSRLVLSQQDASPQNVYLSKAGDPTNWDFNPTPANATQAVALNASSSAGRIGQPVRALIPFRDDVLIIGCDHSLFAMVGDPADGGTITTISDSLGVLQRDAWTIAPNGAVYFVGHGGFYVMNSPTSVPINLALGVYEQFFNGLDRKGNYIMCQWDRDNEGCWIFVTLIETGESTHLWYDSKLKAFWPQRFPDAQGPLCTTLYDGDAYGDRAIYLGGRDGFVRKIDPTALNDDGTPISSYVFIGPFNPYGPFGKAKLVELEGVTGEGTTNLVYEIRSGDDARAALAAVYDFQLSWTTVGRQPKVRQRARGNTMVLKLQNAVDLNRWSLERVAAMFEPSGKMR